MSDGVDWRPVSDIPDEGKFLVALYAPTNWAYYVSTVVLSRSDPLRAKEMKLKYARTWARMPEEPKEFAQSEQG